MDDGDRRHDAITLVLAAILGLVVMGAVGYGIFKSSRVTTAIPSLGGPPMSTTGAR